MKKICFFVRKGSLMDKKKRKVSIIVWLCVTLVLLAGALLTGNSEPKHETIKEVMKDAVLHDHNKISLFGLADVNPGLISALTVTASVLIAALLIRIFVVPKFQYIPGKFQIFLEEVVGFFDNLAKSNSPHRNEFLGAYIFAAGVYIFIGTTFELLGIQGFTTGGLIIALPAPLSDINAAISMGFLSYGVILFGGIVSNGFRGVGKVLKDLSLPVSMSFRLFGALLSGLLVTELVYYYIQLSFVLPVVVGVMFTLLHALVQTYVLTMLTALFYGEAAEKHEEHEKSDKKINEQAIA